MVFLPILKEKNIQAFMVWEHFLILVLLRVKLVRLWLWQIKSEEWEVQQAELDVHALKLDHKVRAFNPIDCFIGEDDTSIIQLKPYVGWETYENSSEIKFMIGSQLIKDLLKSRIGTIEIDFIDNKLGLTSDGSRIELETYTDSDFPELPDLTRAIASFSLNSKILKKAITACKKIATHPITINSTSNLLTIQGTDGHSVTLYRTNLKTSTPDFAFTFDPADLRINDKGDTTISHLS